MSAGEKQIVPYFHYDCSRTLNPAPLQAYDIHCAFFTNTHTHTHTHTHTQSFVTIRLRDRETVLTS